MDHAPLTQHVNTDLSHTRTDGLKRFPIAWIEPPLHGPKFKSRGTAGFIGKVPEVVQARSHKLDGFRMHGSIIYLFGLRSYVLCSRRGAESAEKSPEINLRVSASPRGNETFKPSQVYYRCR